MQELEAFVIPKVLAFQKTERSELSLEPLMDTPGDKE